MLGVAIKSAKMYIAGTWSIQGSIYQQTRTSKMEKVETRVEVESDDDAELVAAVLRSASAGCYAEQALKHPVPIDETVLVNGEAFEIDDYPAKPIRRHRD